MYGRNGGSTAADDRVFENEAGMGFETIAARVHDQTHRRESSTNRNRNRSNATKTRSARQASSPHQHQQQQFDNSQQPRLQPRPWDYNTSSNYFSGDNDLERRDSALWSERSEFNSSDDDNNNDGGGGGGQKRNPRGGGLHLWESEQASFSNDDDDNRSWKSSEDSSQRGAGYVNERLRSAGLCQPPTLESVALAEQYQIHSGNQTASKYDDENYSERNLNNELRGSSKHISNIDDDDDGHGNGGRLHWESSFDDSVHDGGHDDYEVDRMKDQHPQSWETDDKDRRGRPNGSHTTTTATTRLAPSSTNNGSSNSNGVGGGVYDEDLVARYNTLSAQVLNETTTTQMRTTPVETLLKAQSTNVGDNNTTTEAASPSTNYEECDSWRQTPPGPGDEIYYNAQEELGDSLSNSQKRLEYSPYEETDSWRQTPSERQPQQQQQQDNGGGRGGKNMPIVPYPDLFGDKLNSSTTPTNNNNNNGDSMVRGDSPNSIERQQQQQDEYNEELNASGDIVYEEDISFTTLRNQLDSIENDDKGRNDEDKIGGDKDKGRTSSIGNYSASPIREDKSPILSELRKEPSKRSMTSSTAEQPIAPHTDQNHKELSRRTKSNRNSDRNSSGKGNHVKSTRRKENEGLPSSSLANSKNGNEGEALVPYNKVTQQQQHRQQLQQPNEQSNAIVQQQQRPTAHARVPFEQNPETQMSAFNFASEHRIMLKAVLELLSQKDRYSGIGVDVNDPNTLKSGPLKKASHLMRGIWKIKYVEIRKGLFSYYEDAVSKDSTHDGDLLRKNIPLQANLCKCRAVKLQQRGGANSAAGAVFELAVEGRPRKLWMANSREERQAWLSAINDAMVGGSVIRGESHIDHNTGKKKRGVSARSPYKRDLELYEMVQNAIEHAETKDLYIGAISGLGVQSLNVPVRWIMEQAQTSADNAEKAFHEESTFLGVNQLWKDLLRDSVKINGEIFKGDSGHAPERIIGSLTRTIITNDRSKESAETSNPANRISESQALSYARDILLAGNRTRTGGDSYYCVDRLCRSDLVVLVPSTLEAEPLNITVEHIPAEKTPRRGSVTYSMHDRSGWLKTRSRPPNSTPHKPWKKRYFVLSEGSLSYYEKASPRPHGLRGQLLLQNAAIHVSEESYVTKRTEGKQKCYIVSLIMKDGSKDRQLRFEDQKKFFLWAHALESVINQRNKGRVSSSPSVLSKLRLRPGLREEAIDSNKGDGNSNTFKEQAASLGLNEEDFARRGESLVKNAKGRSTVKVVIQACTEYKICTVDPQGDESEDTWATVRAKFLQSFRVGGGSNGRIIRGEEVVQVTVVHCCQFGSIYERAEKVRQLNAVPEPPGATPSANAAKTFSTTTPASPSTSTNLFRSRSDGKGRRVTFFSD